MRILSFVVVLGLLGSLCARAHADDAQRAKELYEEGTRYFDLGQFDKAIDAWQSGYRQKADSRFLYNIAQAYRLGGDLNKAIFFYKGYLRNSPKASNRPEVELKIQALQKQLGEQESARSSSAASHPAAPADPNGDSGRARAAATPGAAPTPAPAAPPPAPIVVTAPPGTGAAPGSPGTAPQPMVPAGSDPSAARAPGWPAEPPPVVAAPAPEPVIVEPSRPLDLGVAMGVDGWNSGVQGKADASFALMVAAGYTFGHQPAAPVRFRLGASFGYTFLKEAASRETFVSLLLVPTIVVRASPRLRFFGELGVGVVGIGGLKPTSALLDHSVTLKINGTQSLAEFRPALGVLVDLTPGLGVFASAAVDYSPKGDHFYQAIHRTELLFGLALRM